MLPLVCLHFPTHASFVTMKIKIIGTPCDKFSVLILTNPSGCKPLVSHIIFNPITAFFSTLNKLYNGERVWYVLLLISQQCIRILVFKLHQPLNVLQLPPYCLIRSFHSDIRASCASCKSGTCQHFVGYSAILRTF